MADDLGFQPAAPSSNTDDIGFQPAAIKVPDTQPVADIIAKNLENQQPPTENEQPQTDTQKLDSALGFQVSDALKNGATSLPADFRAPLIQSYKEGSATNAGDYFQSVLGPLDLHNMIDNSSVLSRTGRILVSGVGMAIGAVPDTIARLMYTGAQAAGIASKDISVDDMPSISGAFTKLGEFTFPNGSPQNEIQKKADQAAQMTVALPLGGASTLPVAAWRTLYLGAAGLFGGEAQKKATQWARDTFPNQPFVQESISQAANWGTMLGVGIGGHAVEPYISPGHEALKPIVADAVGKAPDDVTPQDINQQISKGFENSAPKAQDFHDVAAVMDSQNASNILAAAVRDKEGNITPAVDHAEARQSYANKTGQPDASIDSLASQLEDGFIKKDGTFINRDEAQKSYGIDTAQDLFNFRNRSKNTLDTLHQTYVETGVHPDQVFEDAKENPNIAADIKAGRVPDAYEDLKAKPAVDEEGMVPRPVGEGPLQWNENGVPSRAQAESRSEQNLYQKVPKAPPSLFDFIRQNGGINDEGGEVRSILGRAKDRPGMVNNSGMNLDDMALRAQEAGYLKQGERPSINDLLDKMRDEAAGNKVHSENHIEELDDYHNAINHNGEIDNIAAQLGIDTKGMKHGQFWDEVADRTSQDEQNNIISAHEEAYQDSLTRAEQAHPIEESIQPTLEELENEWRQAEGSLSVEQVTPSFGESRSQPGGGKGLQGSDGSIGGGAGDAGRNGAGGGKPPGGGDEPWQQGPLSRQPALTEPRSFEDQLHQLSTNVTADRIDVLKKAEAAPDVSSKLWEKLYHHEEDPAGVPLTPEERTIYDEHIKPIAEESAELFNRLESLGYPDAKDEERPNADNYTPRYVKGRTRSYGEVLEQEKDGKEARFGGAAGRSMRKTIDAQKSRRFYDAVNPITGERTLVYIDKAGNALKFDKPDQASKFGDFARGQKVAPGSEITVNGQPQKLENTTTKRIEAQTKVRYTKNVFANRLDQLSKLQAAVRNAEFLEAMKSSPEFPNVAIKIGEPNSSVPPETDGRTWRPPQLLQFRNYYMEPKLADALDDFARDTPQEGLATTLNKIGRVMNAVMFLNPKAHIDNVFNHMMVERGLVGNVLNAPSTVRNLVKAMRDVYNVSPDYMEALRTGASLPYAKILGADVHDKLIEKLGFDTDKSPQLWDKIAQGAGYNDASTMMRRITSVPQRVLWFASDAMTLSRIQQLESKGESLEQSIKETEDHMPNYRVPGQVLGSRNLSQLFANPAFGRFGRYEYNRLASYFKMLNDAFGPDKTIGQRAQSFDRMAMIGMYLCLFYPMIDKAWQSITGNKNASTVRSGAITIPQTILDVTKGNKSIHDALSSVFVPGVPLEMASEAITGNYSFSGQPIVRESDILHHPKQAGIDVLNYAGSKLSAIGEAGNVAQGKMTAGQFGYNLLGVKTPTNQQIQERIKYKRKAELEATKRAAHLQQQRNR